ncbi:MAG: DNA polymerase I [Actinomycetota bacterium]|nr:DNA polymerase I [Actinomycetota bacterium]
MAPDPVGPLLLVDGNSLAYRAFYALPTDMATASGQTTNAVFGFTSMLVNLLADHRPSGVAVAFDRPEPTFRHERVPGYKANRAETPDILRQQMSLVRQVVEVLHVPLLEMAGYEADDIVATLATTARDAGREALVVTGDRDAYQLVEDPFVKVLYNRRGVSDYALYDEKGIYERTGVAPASYAQYAALRGDPSDNLPGVPGVGEKTAAKLINTYGDIEGIYAHLDELSPKLARSLSESREQVSLNAVATPAVRTVPLDVRLSDLEVGGWDPEEVRKLFGFLEFRSLLSRLTVALEGSGTPLVDDASAPTLRADVVAPATVDEALRLLETLGRAGMVAVEPTWPARPGRTCPGGLAMVPDTGLRPEGGDDAVWLSGELLSDTRVRESLAGVLGRGGPPVAAHHAKELITGLSTLDVQLTGLDVDTAVAAYLVDPAETVYVVEELASRFLGARMATTTGAAQGRLDLTVDAPEGAPRGQDDAGAAAAGPSDRGEGPEPAAPLAPAAQEASDRALAIARVAPALVDALRSRGQTRLYEEIERPLVSVLAKMEQVGVGVDRGVLEALVDDLQREAAELEESVQELAGVRFKVNSTPQLRQVLYETLGLKPQKRTKTGYSTDAASLERLRGEHPIVEALLRYREVEKLRSTYGVGLLAEVGPDGRIHASFNQTVARTGRLSSDQPNLHNIPVRTEDGRRFRRAFVPAGGYRLLVADYDQVELRVIAHLSGDPALLSAFSEERDIHTATASNVFGVPAGQVTPAMRAKAKMVSYGLAYGMEAYGLSQRLGVPLPEAEAILAAYFDAFPAVRAYMESTVAQARERGYTETPFGRRRHIPELSSTNYRVRQAGERQAMNAGIQGLAADIFKVALVRLDRRLEGLRSRVILQVHDEVLLEVPPDEQDGVGAAVREEMEGAADLTVPLSVHLAWGASWEQAKG